MEELTGWDLAAWRTYREGGTYSVRKSWAPSQATGLVVEAQTPVGESRPDR